MRDIKFIFSLVCFISLLSIVVYGAVPTIDSIMLSSTDPSTNNTDQNLTAHVTSSDGDNDPVKIIYNWLENGTSITVLNMPFEADGDQNATDYSGNGNDGYVDWATWSGSGGFDGKGAYNFLNNKIDLGNPTSMRDLTELTISSWVKTDHSIPQDSPAGTIIDKGCAIILDIVDNELRFSWDYNGGCDSWTTITTSALTNDTWHHLVAVVNSTGFGSLYVDGVEVNSSLGTPLSYVSANWAIGGWVNMADAFYRGMIDEIKIYNKSLSSEQIMALYNNGDDIIISEETVVGDNWSFQATPNDGVQDGATATSNSLLILDHFCGDGYLNPGEDCDDGNVANGDGCDEYCQNEGGTPPPPVPEFSDYAIALLLLTVVGGFVAMRRKQ